MGRRERLLAQAETGVASINQPAAGSSASRRPRGAIIGGGPCAFQKYESAKTLTSRAVSTALCLLDRHPVDVQ